MNRFFRNLYITLVGTVVFLAIFTLLAAYVWHHGAFRWTYQFLVSLGLMMCGFYFLLLSKGDATRRIAWGLTFFVLSPIFFIATNVLFWGSDLAGVSSVATEELRYGSEIDLVEFIMEAEVAPQVPVLLLAVLVFLVGNALFIGRNLGKRRLVAGNLLLLGWAVLAYWMAYAQC
jgi:hypothetical protein